MVVSRSRGHQMAPSESWRAENQDPEVGSDEFDELCKRINHPFDSFEDVLYPHRQQEILPMCPKDKHVEEVSIQVPRFPFSSFLMDGLHVNLYEPLSTPLPHTPLTQPAFEISS